jgi:drug/metabolite transporter (DMT)-like permease
MARAMRSARVAVVAPFEYTSLLWAVLFGYFLFGEVPGNSVALGASLVIGSGLYILYRETRSRSRGD